MESLRSRRRAAPSQAAARSSGSESCTHVGPVSLEGVEAVARRAVLLGEEGERIISVSPSFIYV